MPRDDDPMFLTEYFHTSLGERSDLLFGHKSHTSTFPAAYVIKACDASRYLHPTQLILFELPIAICIVTSQGPNHYR